MSTDSVFTNIIQPRTNAIRAKYEALCQLCLFACVSIKRERESQNYSEKETEGNKEKEREKKLRECYREKQ